MPENLKALRGRIKSIKKTKKITRAMEMVSAAKLRKTEGVMKSSRPFIRKLEMLIARLAQSEGAQDHELFQTSETGVPLLVVFTSDRGLCGAFNANIIKRALVALRERPDYKIFVLGRKGAEYFRKHFPDRLIETKTDLNNRLDGEMTDGLAKDFLNGFSDGRFSEVNVLYPNFISMVSNKPVVERYLPMSAEEFGAVEEDDHHMIDYIMEPTPQRVFDALLPRYLMSKIFLTLAETYTSEHSSRMMAMNNATKNCDELTENLTLRLNKARQASITTEIIEIVSGAAALEG